MSVIFAQGEEIGGVALEEGLVIKRAARARCLSSRRARLVVDVGAHDAHPPRLDHPAIVEPLEVVEKRGRWLWIFDCPGEALEDWLASEPPRAARVAAWEGMVGAYSALLATGCPPDWLRGEHIFVDSEPVAVFILGSARRPYPEPGGVAGLTLPELRHLLLEGECEGAADIPQPRPQPQASQAEPSPSSSPVLDPLRATGERVLQRWRAATCLGLLYDPDDGRGVLAEVTVALHPDPGRGVELPESADESCRAACRRALALGLGPARSGRAARITVVPRTRSGMLVRLTGASLALPVAVATRAALEGHSDIRGWAFTGDLFPDGRVGDVGFVPPKLDAAASHRVPAVGIPRATVHHLLPTLALQAQHAPDGPAPGHLRLVRDAHAFDSLAEVLSLVLAPVPRRWGWLAAVASAVVALLAVFVLTRPSPLVDGFLDRIEYSLAGQSDDVALLEIDWEEAGDRKSRSLRRPLARAIDAMAPHWPETIAIDISLPFTCAPSGAPHDSESETRSRAEALERALDAGVDIVLAWELGACSGGSSEDCLCQEIHPLIDRLRAPPVDAPPQRGGLYYGTIHGQEAIGLGVTRYRCLAFTGTDEPLHHLAIVASSLHRQGRAPQITENRCDPVAGGSPLRGDEVRLMTVGAMPRIERLGADMLGTKALVGRLVVIGARDEGDYRQVGLFGRLRYGMVHVATVADAILRGRLVRTLPWWASVLTTVAYGFTAWLGLRSLPRRWVVPNRQVGPIPWFVHLVALFCVVGGATLLLTLFVQETARVLLSWP